jgi:hypothetical protein
VIWSDWILAPTVAMELNVPWGPISSNQPWSFNLVVQFDRTNAACGECWDEMGVRNHIEVIV